MYTKHFFKMLIGLALMAAIGIAGLVIANYYSKNQSNTTTTTVSQ